MEFKEIEVLIDKINSSEISLFEVKMDNFYIKMDKSLVRDSIANKSKESDNQNLSNEAAKVDDINSQENIVTNNTKSIEITDEISAADTDDNFYIVKSPMVGTFYIAPGVDLDPFVKVGSTVKKGDTLCIIEAMKLMNELESDINGEIAEILVNNGDMVEYGAELFKVRR